ncbi:MAG: hydrolase, partial [Rhodoluna sp.]|nr:hydrolase [Rhodoluna sp.]
MTFKVTIADAAPSLSRAKSAERKPVRVGLVQTKWHEDSAEHEAVLLEGIRLAAEAGAEIVFLPELTLSRYMADTLPTGTPNDLAEQLDGGPTHRLAAKAAAENNVYVHISLYEHEDRADGRGLNCAIIVAPTGEIIARTPKLHIPVTAGYYEDEYFAPGPADGEPYPVYEVEFAESTAHIGLP